jgi:uncharacterized protein
MRKKILVVLLLLSTIVQAQTRPFELGVTDELHSKELGEKRVLNIYFPEGYKQDDTTSFPVIYLLDGSADEDFIHVAGLIQFNSFSWINRIPKSILVGIATVDRRRDFTYPTSITEDQQRYKTAGKSAKFIAFIENELQPYIKKKYKGNGSKMLIGQSLGGLLATEILLKKPYLFDKYIIVSPSLWWDNGSLLNYATAVLEKTQRKTAIYIGVGKEGLTPGATPRVMETDANLLAEKVRSVKNKLINVQFDYLPNEDHGTIMHQAVFNALRLLFPKVADKKG